MIASVIRLLLSKHALRWFSFILFVTRAAGNSPAAFAS
jgi:hypothetical protein